MHRSFGRSRERIDLHHARGLRQVQQHGDALEHWQGLDGAAVARAEGVFRPRALSARPHRHELQDSVDDRVSRPARPRVEPAARRRHEQGGARRRKDLSERPGHARRVLRHAQEGRPAAGHRALRLYRHHRRRAARRGSDAREGALLLAAQRQHGVERVGPAAGVLEPVQDRLRAGHAHPHPSASALDRAQRVGVHRAREDSGHPAVLR